jgi:Ca2+-binding EF-hand superfamily protein
MIREVDVNGDGRIDFDEFVYALGEPDESEEEDSDSQSSTEPQMAESLTDF